jgi:hypothetical protein
MAKPLNPKEPYLKIPAYILNLPQIGRSEKLLLAHIYSFRAKGCWQSNKTMAEIFMVSPTTIRRWLSRIRKYIYIKNPKGYYRTIWAKSYLCKNEQERVQNCASELVKSAHRPAQKCATTNNNTITENKRRTIASPSPLPPKGAPATLIERRKDLTAKVEQLKKAFGGTGQKKWQPMTQQQFANRRAAQLAALRFTEHRRPGVC